MPYIRIQRLWTDSDEMLQLEVTASNDAQVGTQDFYAYPETIANFGRNLMDFPKTASDIVSIEYGVQSNFYCYFLLRVATLNARGNSAFELKFNSRSDPPSKVECNFFMASEPATINSFGKLLLDWLAKMDEPLKFEWKNS